MIICPTCKEEIDDDSHYCDQCGLMMSPDGSVSQRGQSVGMSMPGYVSYGSTNGDPSSMRAMPVLALINDSLNIRINGMNGAIIGRRKGPYTQLKSELCFRRPCSVEI